MHAPNARPRVTYARARVKYERTRANLKKSDFKVLFSARAPIVLGALKIQNSNNSIKTTCERNMEVFKIRTS